MAADFLARIKQSPVLCDGAMGTLLYAKGIFINRSYDELNLSQPELDALANGLTILCRNVHDRADNATMFCIVARDSGEEEEGGAATGADGT